MSISSRNLLAGSAIVLGAIALVSGMFQSSGVDEQAESAIWGAIMVLIATIIIGGLSWFYFNEDVDSRKEMARFVVPAIVFTLFSLTLGLISQFVFS